MSDSAFVPPRVEYAEAVVTEGAPADFAHPSVDAHKIPGSAVVAVAAAGRY